MLRAHIYTALFGKGIAYKQTYRHGSDRELLLVTTAPGAAGEVCSTKLWDTIREAWIGYEKQPLGEAVEEILKVANDFLIDFFARHDVPNFSASLTARHGSELHAAATGEGTAILVRHGHAMQITENEITKEPFANVASGMLEKDDIVIATSANIHDFIDAEKIADIISNSESRAEAEMELHTLGENSETSMALGIAKIYGQPAENEESDNIVETKHVPKAEKQIWHSRVKETIIGKLFDLKIPKLNINLKLNPKKIGKHLDNVQKKVDRSTLTFVLIILVVTLGTSIYVAQTRSTEKRILASFEIEFASVKNLVDSADNQALYDEENAVKKYQLAAEKITSIKKKGVFLRDVERKEKEIQNKLDKIRNITRLDEPLIKINLAAAKATNPLGLLAGDGNFRVFNHENIYDIILDQISPTSLPVAVSHGVYDFGTEGVIFSTVDGRILEWTDRTADTVRTEDENGWRESITLEKYGRNLYLLSPQDGQIWKYRRGRENYGKAEPYIRDESNIASAISMNIDGGIWILQSDGQIKHLFRGYNDQEFELNLDYEFTNPRQIFTTVDSNKLYILDSTSRINVIGKDGKYAGQYIVNTNGEKAKAIFVDEPAFKLYILTKNKIYEAGL